MASSSRSSREDLAREAEAELRRVGGLGRPPSGLGRPPAGRVAQGNPDGPLTGPQYHASSPRATPEEETQALTALAMQQLAERGVRQTAPQYGRRAAPTLSSAEEMRSRALSEMLERRNRMVREQPVGADARRQVPTVGARARAAPIVTAAPVASTTTVARPPGMARDSGARPPKVDVPVRYDDRLSAVSHANLSAIAVLLISMEELPAPPMEESGQAGLYAEVTRQMRQLSMLLERFLEESPPPAPESPANAAPPAPEPRAPEPPAPDPPRDAAPAAPDLAAVRAWALANGYHVATRGRLPAGVLTAYEQARSSGRSARSTRRSGPG